jgi:hypothetical protein
MMDLIEVFTVLQEYDEAKAFTFLKSSKAYKEVTHQSSSRLT